MTRRILRKFLTVGSFSTLAPLARYSLGHIWRDTRNCRESGCCGRWAISAGETPIWAWLDIFCDKMVSAVLELTAARLSVLPPRCDRWGSTPGTTSLMRRLLWRWGVGGVQNSLGRAIIGFEGDDNGFGVNLMNESWFSIEAPENA